VHRDTTHAAEMAEAQGVGAPALLGNGIIDWIVPEHPDASSEPGPFCRRVGAALEYLLARRGAEEQASRLDARLERYRGLGLR